MIIPRIKIFSEDDQQNIQPPQQSDVTSRDLLIEQMKMQRQAIQLQHQREQLQAKEQMAKARRMVQIQKMQKEEDQSKAKDQIRIKQQENGEDPKNTGLYKSRATKVQPVSMPTK